MSILRVFSDVANGPHVKNAFEDWYVHLDLVDMDYINKISGQRRDSFIALT
jgi:hypothetical protein